MKVSLMMTTEQHKISFGNVNNWFKKVHIHKKIQINTAFLVL